jgi:translation initiation factor IF-1
MPDKGEKDNLVFSGVVAEALPDTTFRVRLDNDKVVLAYLSGKMRLHYIRVVPGDKVKVQMSPHDSARGRIVFRDK